MIPKIVATLAKVCTKEVGREIFKNVVVEPNKAYASDTYMIVKIDYEPRYDVKDYPTMSGAKPLTNEFEPFLLHKDNIQNLMKSKMKKDKVPILFNTLGVVTEQDQKKTIVCNTDLSMQNMQIAYQGDSKYPSIDEWINPEFEDKERAYVKITVDLMQKLFTVFNDMELKRIEMGVSIKSKKRALTFTGETRDGEKVSAILLPYADKDAE